MCVRLTLSPDTDGRCPHAYLTFAPPPSRPHASQFAGLQSLIEHYGAARLLAAFPAFLPELFPAMGDVVVRNPGGHLLAVFLASLKAEAAAPGVPPEAAAERCLTAVLPAVIDALLLEDAGMRDGMTTYALEPILQAFPSALQRALGALSAKRRAARDGGAADATLWAMLAVLKTARQLGQFDGADLENIMRATGMRSEVVGSFVLLCVSFYLCNLMLGVCKML